MAKKTTIGESVTYTYHEVYVEPQVEEFHGKHQLGDYTILELDSVMLDIGGDEIDILGQLNEDTIDKIYQYLESINF
jgi:hypothetical protein